MSSLTRRLRWLLPALVAVAWLAAAGPLNVVGSRLGRSSAMKRSSSMRTTG